MSNTAPLGTINSFLLLACSATVMGIANLATKTATTRASLLGGSYYLAVLRQPWFYGGVLLVGIASVLWLKVIATLGLSIAYPLFVGITYLALAIGSAILLGEHIGPQRVIGAIVLFAGIAIMARS